MAHSLEVPPVALVPEAYSLAENKLLATSAVSREAHSFADPSGTVVPSACSFAEYTPLWASGDVSDTLFDAPSKCLTVAPTLVA